MSLLNQANNISTTLSGNGGSITSGATSLKVASSTGFPSVPFVVIIGTELILVTNVASLTWTVIRGSESTTAAAHNDGDEVRQVGTAAWANSAVQLQSSSVSAQTGLISLTQNTNAPTLTAANTASGLSAAADGISASTASIQTLATAGRFDNSGSGPGLIVTAVSTAGVQATTSGNAPGLIATASTSANSSSADGLQGITSSTSTSAAAGRFTNNGSGYGLHVSNNSATVETVHISAGGGGPGLVTPNTKVNGVMYTVDTYANRPGSPATGDIHYATDRHIEYYWDGTRWLSKTLYYVQFDNNSTTIPLTASNTAAYVVDRPAWNYDMYLIDFAFRFRVAATFDSTHHWTMTLDRVDSANAQTAISASIDTFQTGRTAGTFYYETPSTNANLTLNTVVTITNGWQFRTNWTLVSTAGALTLGPFSLSYRLVG